MGFLIEKVIEDIIDAGLEISGIKDAVGRNERLMRLRKNLKLDSVESLDTFEDVYAYAVMEYAVTEEGLRKPRALVAFF